MAAVSGYPMGRAKNLYVCFVPSGVCLSHRAIATDFLLQKVRDGVV
jgi:hypothetical protein